MKCVILAGGAGNTLWPLSRKKYPKQFINICEGRSLLQDTIVRNLPFADEFIIVTNEMYSDIIETQMYAFQGLSYRIIYEESSRGTFAAVTLASLFLNSSEIMMVTVSDLVIKSGDYKSIILQAKEYAKEGNIANIINENEHIGIYICQVGIYNKMVSELYPDINLEKRKSLKKSLRSVKHVIHVPLDVMVQFSIKSVQNDFLRKTDKIVNVYSELNCKDIDNICDLGQVGYQIYSDNIIEKNCSDTLLINTAEKHLVVANNVDNIAVVNTDDATYISLKENIEDIKNVIADKIDEYKPYFESSRISFRNWGTHEILVSTEKYKVKRVVVYPGKSMKLHKHEHRMESWTIAEGSAVITVGNTEKEYFAHDTVSVPIGIPHKVANISNENVVIIETGIGEILSENDFMRVDTDISDVGLITDLIKLEPAYKDNLWGGTKLRTIFGKKCDYDIIGESWELSAHPDGQSIIANGIYKGMYFGEVIEKAGNEILGWKCGSFDRFPILIKFIDARQALSIQIHPDDEYALEVENEFGKNEMWYVVDCEPGAYLYCGLSKDTSKEEIEQRIKNNTITDILNKIEVKPGDCVFVKAGTIHAIGAGILICEIQQNSNCTYRMYDYDRKDKFGNKRELHIKKALDVVNVKKYIPFRKKESEQDIDGINKVKSYTLVSCKYFECFKYNVFGECNIKGDSASFISIIIISGSGEIKVDSLKNSEAEMFKAGDSFFVCAGQKNIKIVGTAEFIVTKL